MQFDIPMNSKGVLDLNSLSSMSGGGIGVGTPQAVMQQPQMNVQQVNVQQSQMNVQQMNMLQPQVAAQQTQMVQPKQRPQGNGVHLRKGQKVNLAPAGTTLQSIRVCLGWDVLNQACDLDASAFMLGADGKVLGDDWFVFYGQTTSPDGSIQHSGDSQGEGVGDDEIISINLQAINQNVKKVVFVVTINEALERGLNFSMVSNAYVRVVSQANNEELIKFTLSDYYANVTSMVVGEVYNHNGQWKFNAVGDGVAKDLAGLCEMYGVNVAD